MLNKNPNFEHVTASDIQKVEQYKSFLEKVIPNIKEDNMRGFLIATKKKAQNRIICLRAAYKQNKKATA